MGEFSGPEVCGGEKMPPVAPVSLVDSEQSQKVKKCFYIPDQDEFSTSSGPLNSKPVVQRWGVGEGVAGISRVCCLRGEGGAGVPRGGFMKRVWLGSGCTCVS